MSLRGPLSCLALLVIIGAGSLGPASAAAHPQATVSCNVGGALRIGGAFHSTMGTGNIPGVGVRVTGPGGCQSDTRSGTGGRYVFSGLAPGKYTVTPFRAGCGFDPPQRTVALSSRSRAVSFDATCV